MEDNIDLLKNYHLLPQDVQDALASFDENEDGYKECARVLELVEQLGYTFDYYLDAVPYDLRLMDFDWWLNSDNVVKVEGGYITQCTQWKGVFTFDEVKKYYKKEYENN